MDEIAALYENSKTKYVLLNIPEAMSRERAKIRREKAAVDGVAPRRDDGEEVVETRLAEFKKNTEPMLASLDPIRLTVIDGVGTINDIARWTLDALDITPSDEIIARAV